MIHPSIYWQRAIERRWQAALLYWAFVVFLPLHFFYEVRQELEELRREEQGLE